MWAKKKRTKIVKVIGIEEFVCETELTCEAGVWVSGVWVSGFVLGTLVEGSGFSADGCGIG